MPPAGSGRTHRSLQVKGESLVRPGDASAAADVACERCAGRDVEHPCHSGRVRWMTCAAQPVPYRPSGQGDRCCREKPRVGRVERGGKLVEEVGLIPEKVGLTGQHRDEISPGGLGQAGQDVVTHSVAQEPAVLVRRVVHHVESQFRADLARLVAAEAEEGAPMAGSHPGQAVECCAAKQIDHHRLCLVITRVAGKHIEWKRRVSGAPGAGFEVRAVSDMHGLAPGGHPESVGRPSHHDELGGRTRSEPVVDVHCGGMAAGSRGKHEQGEGVGPSRDGAGDGSARRRKRAACEQGSESVFEFAVETDVSRWPAGHG